MAKTNSINANTPPDTGEPVKFGALRIRELKLALIELLGIDHYLGTPVNGNYSEDAAGKHKQITFVGKLAETPTLATSDDDDDTNDDTGILYIREDAVTETDELFFLDAADNEIQLTRGGKLFAEDVLRMYSATTPDADYGAYSQLQFLKTLSTDDSALMAKIAGSHYGTGSDKKGQLQLFVNTGAEAAPDTTGIRITPEGILLKGTFTNENGDEVYGLPIKDVVDPEDAQDAATKNYVDGVAASAVSITGSGKLSVTDGAVLTINPLVCHGLRCIVMLNGSYNIGARKTVTLTLKTKNLTTNAEVTIGTYTFGSNTNYNDDASAYRPDDYSFAISEIVAATGINTGNQSFTVYAKVNEDHAIGSYLGHCSLTVFEVR